MLILASQSPRRRELLTMLGVDFTVITADIDETMDPALLPEQEVARVCAAKAAAVGTSHPDDLILAADTIVVLDNRVLGKPHSPEEAAQMLRALSGRTHRVMTGFCLYRNGQADTHVEITAVTFRTLSEEEIQAYIATGSPMDKAGAYGIQEQAGIFVRSVEGDYYNVIGLPICPLAVFLRQQGVAVLGTVSS